MKKRKSVFFGAVMTMMAGMPAIAQMQDENSIAQFYADRALESIARDTVATTDAQYDTKACKATLRNDLYTTAVTIDRHTGGIRYDITLDSKGAAALVERARRTLEEKRRSYVAQIRYKGIARISAHDSIREEAAFERGFAAALAGLDEEFVAASIATGQRLEPATKHRIEVIKQPDDVTVKVDGMKVEDAHSYVQALDPIIGKVILRAATGFPESGDRLNFQECFPTPPDGPPRYHDVRLRAG